MAAIYLLTPTSQNVQLILSDFQPSATATAAGASAKSASSTGKLSSKKSGSSSSKDVTQSAAAGPKYASAYLHFVDGEESNCFERLACLSWKRVTEDTARPALAPGIDDRLVERLTNVLPDGYLLALKELYTNFHREQAQPCSWLGLVADNG